MVSWMKLPTGGVALAAVLLVGVFSSPAAGQTWMETFPPDAYGNAGRALPQRRYLSPLAFPNETQRRTSQDYQTLGFRADRRGGFAGFALPGDVLAGNRLATADYLAPGGEVPPATRQAFRRYGGFGKRPGHRLPSDLTTILSRRYALVEAASLNAPVHRAIWATAQRGITLPASTVTPLTPLIVTASSAQPTTLDRYLRYGLAVSVHRSREEGWGWFEEGAYRRAARVFESALVIQPSDLELRLGELFSYVCVAAVRTAIAALDDLNRRTQNPFSSDLDLTERIASVEEARRVRLESQWLAQAEKDDPQAIALHLFILWYLGERQEAILTARAASAMLADTAYADWPAKMQSAQAALAPAGEAP